MWAALMYFELKNRTWRLLQTS